MQKDICTSMFRAALSVVVKTWKQLKCPLMDKWIEELWHIQALGFCLALIKKEIFCHCDNMVVP